MQAQRAKRSLAATTAHASSFGARQHVFVATALRDARATNANIICGASRCFIDCDTAADCPPDFLCWNANYCWQF
jgi:hypothetical protein